MTPRQVRLTGMTVGLCLHTAPLVQYPLAQALGDREVDCGTSSTRQSTADYEILKRCWLVTNRIGCGYNYDSTSIGRDSTPVRHRIAVVITP